MTDPASRLRRHVLAVILVGMTVLGTGGCSLFTGDTPDEGGNSVEQNMDLAEAVADQIAEDVPGATVTVNYRDDTTVPATLALTVRVDDQQAALSAVAGETAPAGTALDDAARPLAPIAVIAARTAWQSEIEPLRSLSIDIVPGGDPAAGDSWNIGVGSGKTEAAFNETFGDRP